MTSAGAAARPRVRAGSRVAVILHEPQLGGATLSLLSVIPLLEERGWRFSFWAPGRGPAEQEVRRRGYEVDTAERLLRFSVGSLREPPGPVRRLASTPGYLRSWRDWLARQEASLIHANTILALPELASRPRRTAPAILHSHEVVPSGPRGRLAALLARRADLVVTVSQAAADAMRRRGIESTVVYPAVRDPGELARPPREGAPLVVGTLGTVSKRKGSDVFVAAARKVRERRNGVEFRMVGEPVVGGERAWAQGVLDAARAAGIRHTWGVEPFAELAQWDIFVLPSRMDPCPLAMLEAMATGLPVIGSDVGGIPEQVGSDGGVLVSAEDADGLADSVLRLAGDPALRAALGAAASRRVRELFTLERQADGLDGAYRRAAGLSGHEAAAPARSS
jgi:glycosyltransferase involved in cell wall biosynthesis